jgi:selenocysteine-specific elongation factor
VWDAQAFEELVHRVTSLLQKLQQAAPWKPGWRRDELGKLLAVKTGKDDGLPDLLEELARQAQLQRRGPLFCTPDHQPRLPEDLQVCAQALLSNLAQDGVNPRDWEHALAEVAPHSKSMQMLEEHLLGLGHVERLTERLAFVPSALEAARETLRQRSQGQPFTASQAREWLNTSRKYVIPILEWMDQKGWTHRAGDQRVLAI